LNLEHFSCHLKLLKTSLLKISIVFSNGCKLAQAALSSLAKKGALLALFCRNGVTEYVIEGALAAHYRLSLAG
jgi:phosphoketolase